MPDLEDNGGAPQDDGPEPAPQDDAPEPQDDAGDDAPQDDPADDGADDGDDGADPAPEEPPRRTARDRIQNLQRERDAERERAARFERDLAEERARAEERERAAAARQEADEAARERALLNDMPEDQRTQYLLAKEVKATKDNQARLERQLADQADRSQFQLAVAKDKRMARYADEVEQMAAKFPGATRMGIYLTLLGKKVHEGAEQGARQRQAAGERVERQRAPAARVRSNAPAQRGRGGSLVERMERDDVAI